MESDLANFQNHTFAVATKRNGLESFWWKEKKRIGRNV